MITKSEKIEAIKRYLQQTHLDPGVTKQTLGVPYSSLVPEALLATSVKILKINQGKAEPDDRDDLRFSNFYGVEDYFKEHLDKDFGRWQKKALQKIQQKRNLSWLSAGFFSPQLKSVVISNPLSTAVEGINPVEYFDNSHKITKMGPGGIASPEAIPPESRAINPSSFGFLDPVHVPEREKIGVVNYATTNVVKGKDNKLYKLVKDKNGKLVWVDHETLLNKTVEIPSS